MWRRFILVGVGGGLGSMCRYGVGLLAQRVTVEWPLGTLVANILACLTVGAVTALATRGEALSPAARLALATGFCGGFSTMATFIYETNEMLRASEYLHVLAYAAGSFVLSLAAFLVGVAAIRLLFRVGGA